MPRTAPRTRPHGRQGLAAILGGGAALLLLAGLYLWLLGGTAPPQTAAIGGAFVLTGTGGQTVSDRSLRGRYLLIYFGYTSCRDVCPATLAAASQAIGLLGQRGSAVQPVFITVDPQRDTPAVLHAFLSEFPRRILGLTGTPGQIQAVEQEYRVSSVIQNPQPGSARYDVDHSSVFYLVGPDGQYLAPIRADESAAAMARDIARHLS